MAVTDRLSRTAWLLAGALMLLGGGPPAAALTPTREQVLEGKKARFHAMDRDRDGRVSLEEYLAYLQADTHPLRRAFFVYQFRAHDKNGDGFLTMEEHLGPVTLQDEFRALDQNRDGRISREEFLEGEKQFRSLDRNGDGFISWEEYQALRVRHPPPDKR